MWNSFAARMRTEANRLLSNNKDGAIISHVTFIINSRGEPEGWWIESSSRIEPSKSARDVLARLGILDK